jgi:hypothetical protein
MFFLKTLIVANSLNKTINPYRGKTQWNHQNMAESRSTNATQAIPCSLVSTNKGEKDSGEPSLWGMQKRPHKISPADTREEKRDRRRRPQASFAASALCSMSIIQREASV